MVYAQMFNDDISSFSHPCLFKGSLTRDFRLQVFFMNQCPPGPQVFHWGCLEFFRKFAEMFANEYLFDTGDKLFSGVNDTGEKFIDTGDLSLSQGNNQKA
jgi:hypothetical protein